MFHRDQPIIGAYAQASPDNMAAVYRFVLATIQQPLETVPTILRDFRAEGSASRFAFSSKRVALRWMEDRRNIRTLYKGAMALRDGTDAELLGYFASLPGLGLVKGGFMVQLIFGRVGCLDMHNIVMLDIPASRFKGDRYKTAKREVTRQAVLQEYLDACRGGGGCEVLWNNWCDYVAELRPNKWSSGDAVSAAHPQFILQG